jgi:hypothetical protein
MVASLTPQPTALVSHADRSVPVRGEFSIWDNTDPSRPDLLDVVLPAHDAAPLVLDAVTGISPAESAADVLDVRLGEMVGLTIRGLSTCGGPR